MNRRDMIIVAALINAGLLVVLFVSAVKPGNSEEKSSLASLNQPAEKIETAVTKPASSPKGDQIDQVINEYSAKVAQKEQKETTSLPLPVLTPEPKIASAEPAPKAPLKPSSGEFRTVTVEKGDVLERIARHNGVTVEELMKLNDLSNSRLQIGQVLKLPAKSSTKVVKKKTSMPAEGKYYTVKGGDNPWTIAQKNGMQVDELLELNNMDEEKAKRLRPGDKLKIK